MTTITEKNILRKKLEKYEGKVSHMYRDSKGYITVGVGHLLKSVYEAQILRFEDSNNNPATNSEIKLEFETIQKLPADLLASAYKKHATLTLPDTEIKRLTEIHINSFEKELEIIYPDFRLYPTQVRLALFDLIFNLGMTKLQSNWPIFNSAIKAKNWQKAADNSKRKSPVSAARNKYVKDLLEQVAKP